MKIDGRTKSGKMIKQDLKTLGLVGKILRVWWLFAYLPFKYLFLVIRFIIKKLIVATKYLWSKFRNKDQ